MRQVLYAKSAIMRVMCVLSCAAIFVCSCEKVEVPKLDDNDKSASELKVAISLFDVTMSEMDTKAQLSQSSVTKISFAVFDESGKRVVLEEQEKGISERFGEIDCKLTSGTYTLVAVAHKSKSSPDISLESVEFPDDGTPGNEVGDTFSALQSVTIGEGTYQEVSMMLKRVVALFQLVCEDALPQNVKSFMIDISGGSDSFSPNTGFATYSKPHRFYYSVDSADWGNRNYALDCYMFLQEEVVEMDISVTAVDMEGEEIKTLIFNKVLLALNKKVTATGSFFQQKQTCAFDIDEEWGKSEYLEF